jgi:hypothetical protein
VATELTERGFAVLTHDIGTEPPSQVAETLAGTVLARLEDQAGDA